MSISCSFCSPLSALLKDRGSERREGKASLSVISSFVLIGQGKGRSMEKRREQELFLGISVHPFVTLFSKWKYVYWKAVSEIVSLKDYFFYYQSKMRLVIIQLLSNPIKQFCILKLVIVIRNLSFSFFFLVVNMNIDSKHIDIEFNKHFSNQYRKETNNQNIQMYRILHLL